MKTDCKEQTFAVIAKNCVYLVVSRVLNAATVKIALNFVESDFNWRRPRFERRFHSILKIRQNLFFVR